MFSNKTKRVDNLSKYLCPVNDWKPPNGLLLRFVGLISSNVSTKLRGQASGWPNSPYRSSESLLSSNEKFKYTIVNRQPIAKQTQYGWLRGYFTIRFPGRQNWLIILAMCTPTPLLAAETSRWRMEKTASEIWHFSPVCNAWADFNNWCLGSFQQIKFINDKMH